MIKQLRKFSNMTIICVTQNDQIKTDLTHFLSDIKLLSFTNLASDIIDTKPDIVIVDYNFNGALELMNELSCSVPLISKIVILEDINDTNIIDCLNVGVVSIIKYPIKLDDLRLDIIVALNKSKRTDKVFLNEDFYYDAYRTRFYHNDNEVELTKFEFNVLKLLVENSTKIISYDEIKEKVWKDKPMSIFTMRNVVNKIRKKTYHGIIKNNSSKGYQIDSKQNKIGR